jgi:hypothetical protein
VSSRRTFYTRQEAARLCRRSQWTLIRWEKEGLLTKLSDPSDPSGRHVQYAGPEVEALARRLRRLEEGGPGDAESEPGRVPRDRESSRPKVPRRRRPPPARSLAPAKMSLAPMPVPVHAVPRSTPRPSTSAGSTRSPSDPPEAAPPPNASLTKPLSVSHAPLPSDTEAERWAHEIDERKRAWEMAQVDAATEREDSPPSSASRS